mmetsp:Transcript_16139/g.51791  ORF Transcript_16139/g.51791 Transcript_16139/m.51791 type:complete len:1080 (-) Transcript_16139:650-3889(-)
MHLPSAAARRSLKCRARVARLTPSSRHFASSSAVPLMGSSDGVAGDGCSGHDIGCQAWPAGLEHWSDSVRVFRMLIAFRRRGHLAARLDPLRGSAHRPLSPLEPISWRIGGRHGYVVDRVDINRLLRDYPRTLDLDVFGLSHYGEDAELPQGVSIPAFWGAPPDGGEKWTFRSFVEHLRKCYAGKLTLEHQHLDSDWERSWLEERFEGRFALDSGTSQAMSKALNPEIRKAALLQLVRADQLEQLLGDKFPSAKRFGVRGLEALLPCLWTMLEKSAELGVERLQLGMAHRGRLNVLVNFLGKKVSEICSEFSEQVDFLGDMKYHLGTRGRVFIGGRDVQLTLAPNPSHLEAVNPVVLGMTRAKLDQYGDSDMRSTMAVLIHGDAAFTGQGVIAECMQLADLPEYSTGGTVHIVLNNNIGFTTDPRAARSSYHCTNVAKVNDAPIIHVNADDVDAVLFAGILAAEYRAAFRKDVVIDLVGYRRQGHSELDDDALTQPLTRRITQQHPPVLEIYSEKLINEKVVSREDVEANVDQVSAEFEAEHQYATTSIPSMADWQPQVMDWQKRPVNITGLPEPRLVQIGQACARMPEGFAVHDTVKRIFEGRLRQLSQGRIDWALAEQLAIGSLLLRFSPEHGDLTTGLIQDDIMSDGAHEDHAPEVDCYVVHPPCPVRLSGQDVERGTFNQRHAIIHNQLTAVPHNVFSDMGLGPQSKATVCNSSLSELAILGFEYGYSLEESLALTIWEAQFGDFANCAQHIIDNFIISGESKWGTKSCLVLLLPHGYEGQGPEHSSGRVERFLQLVDDDADDLWPDGGQQGSLASWRDPLECPDKGGGRGASCGEARQALRRALDAKTPGTIDRAMRSIELLQETYDYRHNISVVNITTPANLFHALRRQVHRTFAKPLVVMSAKYLLHHRPCRSPLAHMGRGTRFRRVIEEGGRGDNMPSGRKNSNGGPCERLIFCSGKVFYELHHARAARKLEGQIALARLEQIAPFPSMEIALCASRHPNAEIMWVQEEPKNMGAWSYVAPRIATSLRELCGDTRRVTYVGRPPASSPATPLFKNHKREVRTILDAALKLE